MRKAILAAAAELRLPDSSWQARRYGLLTVAHENLSNKLASGGDVRIADLIAIDQQMAEIRAACPPEPISVELDIVEGISVCPACGFRGKTADLPPPDDDPPPSPPDKPSDDAPASPAATGATNVVKLPQYRDRSVSQSSFHNQIGTPLKKLQEYPGLAQPAHGHFGAGVLSEPAPDWSASHVLPSPAGQEWRALCASSVIRAVAHD